MDDVGTGEVRRGTNGADAGASARPQLFADAARAGRFEAGRIDNAHPARGAARPGRRAKAGAGPSAPAADDPGRTSTRTPPRCSKTSGRKWTAYSGKGGRFHEDVDNRDRALRPDEGSDAGDRPWRPHSRSKRAEGWFTSSDSFAKLLSEHNRRLLELIAREHPRSLTELAEKAGRSKSNLSRTLKTMSQYGLVELRRGEGGTLVPSGAVRSGTA